MGDQNGEPASSCTGYAVDITNPAGETSVSLQDGAGRTIMAINPEGHVTTIHYDTIDGSVGVSPASIPIPGNLLSTKSIDAKGNKRHWFFDQRNLNVTKAYPDGSEDGSVGVPPAPGNAGNNGTQSLNFYTQNFDALGRVAIKVDQIGTTCTNIYDLAGRLTEKQYQTGATPAQGGIITC